MRIYAVADIHGKPDRIRTIQKHVRTFEPDVLVAAGDITQFLNAGRVLSRFNALPVPVLAVRGNTDRPHVEKSFRRLANIIPLHLQSVHIRGVRFAGVSGTALLPFRSRVRYWEGRVFDRLEPLLETGSVLVAHPPPWGVRDEVLGRFHSGSRRLLQAIRKHRPALVLFGHIHERAGFEKIGDTVAVNCAMGSSGGGAMVDIHSGQVADIRMLGCNDE